MRSDPVHASQALRGFTFDGGAPFFYVPPSLVEPEAEQGASLAELRAGLDTAGFLTLAEVEALQESAQERAAISAEGLLTSGLVSVPTTHKRIETAHAHALAVDRTRDLRRSLRAVDVDKRKARVSGLRRAVGFSARAIGAALDRPGSRARYCAMLTLTYRDGADWRPEHLTRLMNHVRNWLQRERGEKLHYVWVAELQKRGALHYHIAMWLPAGVLMPKADNCGWWPHGSTNVKQARKAVPYLMKYLSKSLDVAGFPKGARMHGSGGVDHQLRRARRWLGLPAFVRSRSDIHDEWTRATGGGWRDPEGTVIPSEYQRAWVVDRFSLVQVADYGRPFAASGPFSWLSRSGVPS